jgi:DNA-binding response OmpR family regulator
MTPRLLVLDDQVQYGRSLDRALRREYELVLTVSQAEARQRLTSDICGVLADVRLDESKPNDRQGLEFVSWAREQRHDLPIISMSALDDESLESDALRAGATKFLRKPIVISHLRALLQELLGKER